ncbi:MAG: cytochrome C [Chitinophagaceae bacterium]
MMPSKPSNRKIVLLFLSVCFLLSINVFAQDGKQLFQSNCAACHAITSDLTGPKLENLLNRDPYNGDMKKIVNWVQHAADIQDKDPYYKQLKAKFNNVPMPSFPGLSEKQIEAIVNYVSTPEIVDVRKPPEPSSPKQNWIIFGIISLIMAIIALILMQVNSNLKKLSDDTEGIVRPEPVPFYRNKVYITLITIVLFVVAGYYLTAGAIGLGRQKNYQPKQPIFYSHKVHAGINQINCLYCHGNAWESKHAAIPSVNVCMNCHKTIQEYKGAPLYDDAGNEINGTQEIKKLYSYAGFDPNNSAAWNPSMIKAPILWIKIHNLPDHVFFSHAQHVRAGNVQCQTCHGPITEMDEVKQFAELSMGWCINCHRETKVNFNYSDSTGNKFYSLYEKFHNDIRNHKMDSVTVEDIGGLECQKCHY